MNEFFRRYSHTGCQRGQKCQGSRLFDRQTPPNVGVVLTDPRGRLIGFDPLRKKSGRHYLWRKVTSIAMIWMVEVRVVEWSRYASGNVSQVWTHLSDSG